MTLGGVSMYRPRVIDATITNRLKNKGAILVEGAKWCGKTTTCEQHAASILYMSDPDRIKHHLQLAEISPRSLLLGETPRLIDEWQIAPKLWDAVRFETDHREGFGHFLLTGSSVPAEMWDVHHTGTGRFAWLRMRPMSLYESEESTGEVSLGTLFQPDDTPVFAENHATLQDIAFLICRGGWPQATFLQGEDALVQSFDYLDAVVKSDICRVDGVSRNETRARLLMRSLARHQGTQASNATIGEDIHINEDKELSRDTVASYTNALKKIFVIEDCPAWSPNLRSKTAIRTSDTRFFVDPSIATAALGIGPGDLMNDLETFGLFFETLCIRDLRVYAEALGGNVYHFRTKDDLECDAVIHLRDGSYGLIEVKLGGDKLIEEGARMLKTIANKIDTSKMKSPSFMMILTATAPYAYKRADGVYVVPVTTLKH
ncbi:MAG: ATP-binding protein [Proteobacteria bacterium]|nr:ATP-binding protein [Pseudomonadota bacterium]